MQGDQGGSQRRELTVASSYFNILRESAAVAADLGGRMAYSSANSVGNVATSALSVLACMHDLDV